MAFEALVRRIRNERKLGREVPGFDPVNGNEQAFYLFLLEAPGPKAVQTGFVSISNPDPTARNFQHQLARAGVRAEEIALWNVVPWYLGDENGTKIRGASAADVHLGMAYLPPLIAAMPELRCIVLVGGAARKAHVCLSKLTTARILSCHHPSAQALNANPANAEENVAVLRFMKETSAGFD
jgi:uracil-DNA glycosylase